MTPTTWPGSAVNWESTSRLSSCRAWRDWICADWPLSRAGACLDPGRAALCVSAGCENSAPTGPGRSYAAASIKNGVGEDGRAPFPAWRVPSAGGRCRRRNVARSTTRRFSPREHFLAYDGDSRSARHAGCPCLPYTAAKQATWRNCAAHRLHAHIVQVGRDVVMSLSLRTR